MPGMQGMMGQPMQGGMLVPDPPAGAMPPPLQQKKPEPAAPKEPPKPSVPQCFLHKKPSPKCKNCERYRVAVLEMETALKEQADEAQRFVADSDELELTN